MTFYLQARRYSQFEGLTKTQLRRKYLGALIEPNFEALAKTSEIETRVTADTNITYLKSFFVGQKWPNCLETFYDIQDQLSCGSCWAVSTAAAITDRRCIVHNKPQTRISAWDLVTCCTQCFPSK